MKLTAENYWPALWDFLIQRLRKPMGHPSYWFYFVVILIGVGAIGVWKGVFYDCTIQAVASNLMTFFPAIAAASAFEIVLSRHVPKCAQTFTILVGALLAVAVGYLWFFDKHVSAIFVGFIGAIASLMLWWIANAENSTLLDSPPGKDPLGGEPSQNTQGGMGDLQG